MHRGCSAFPHRFCSAKGPPGCPGQKSNQGPTEWQAGALTIELRLTPFELRLIPFELRLTPFELRLTPFKLRLTPIEQRLTPV